MVLHRLVLCLACVVLTGLPLRSQLVSVPAENPPELVARLQGHYRAALAELQAADVSHLSAVQLSRRGEVLAELAAYCERGRFVIARNPDMVREPSFVDGGGRLCAVANLMAKTGERSLVDQVARTANRGFVVELASVPALVEWLDRVGLSVEEAARIQAPSTTAPTAGPSLPTGGPSGWSPPPGSGSSSGSSGAPRGVAAANPAGGNASAGADSRDGPASRGDSRTSGQTTRGTSGRDGELHSGLAWDPDGTEDGWWLWWEMNKLRFLAPHRLTAKSQAVLTRGTNAGATGGLSRTLADDARAELLPLVLSLTQDEDAMLRARAAATLGRLGGKAAVEPLTAMLGDSQVLVRHAAILGLGATGAMEAAPTLLHIATSGSLPGSDGAQLSSWARPLACVALGLGRRHGMSPVVDGFVAEVATADARERADIGTAALLYQTLSPCEALSSFALSTLDDAQAEPLLRCRATETLGLSGDAAQLPRMTHLLGDGQVEVRRSAALAMSGLSHPLALPALQTAYELEEEPLVRGFLLLAVAEQGGEGARDFLVRAAQSGPMAVRPWGAIGLGLMARALADAGDATASSTYTELCEVLRKGLDSDVNHGDRGAWILAAGIARDPASAPRLRHAMAGSKDQRIRMFAALALGMIGDEESRPLMLEALRMEAAPLAIVGLTQAIGSFGVPADGPELVKAVQEMRVPATQALLAVALAFHGSESAVAGLMQIARNDQCSAAARAAAVDGLGLLLDDEPGLMLQEVAASANFYAFPDWVNGLLTSFTL